MTQASFRTAHPLFLDLEQEVADIQRDFEHQILLRRPLPFRFDGLAVSHNRILLRSASNDDVMA